MAVEYKRLLKHGMKGDDVKRLQEALVKLGYSTNGIDGIWGNGTENAVRSFQKDNKLTVDGLVGKNTIKKINELLKNHTPVTVNPSGYRKLRRFSSDVHIFETNSNHFVDVDLGERNKLERLSTIVNNHLKKGKKIVAAINCGFFSWTGNPEHLGMLVDEGLYYNLPHKDFLDYIYYKDGRTEVVNLGPNDRNVAARLQRESHWAIGTSYSLIQDGKINLENNNKHPHAKYRNPRTLFGQKKNGSFVLAVVDGRRVGSLGVTDKQSAEIMLELGCHNAVNFDGGGSSTMVVVQGGKPVVVNRPSDGSERAIGSCMLVIEK